MKLHKWRDIRRITRKEGLAPGQLEKEMPSLDSLEDVIKAMDIQHTVSPQLSSSESRKEIDSEHNSGYNNK